MLRLGYCLPFLSTPPLPLFPSQCLLPAPSPLRGLLWRRSPWAYCQGCSGACSTPFSRLLQPSVRSMEDLGVMASGHRPLPSHSLCGRVPLSAGDHSVCTPVSTSGRLDGLHRSQGSVSSGASSSCFSSLSSLHVPWHGLPVQSSVLCPLHGSAGLHQGHGSCFQLYSILWVSVCVDTSMTGWSSLPLGSLSLRICRLSSNFVKNWGLSSTPEVQPHTFPARTCRQ